MASPPEGPPSSATRSPGTRSPACHPPGQGHLVPHRKGPPAAWQQPHPLRRRKLERDARTHAPSPPPPAGWSSTSPGLQGGKGASSSALLLIFPCAAESDWHQKALGLSSSPYGEGPCLGCPFSRATTRATGRDPFGPAGARTLGTLVPPGLVLGKSGTGDPRPDPRGGSWGLGLSSLASAPHPSPHQKPPSLGREGVTTESLH